MLFMELLFIPLALGTVMAAQRLPDRWRWFVLVALMVVLVAWLLIWPSWPNE